MDRTLREDIAVIGNTAAALIIALLAVAGGIVLGFPRTMGLELLLITTYLAVYGVLRLTTRPLRRLAPAAPAADPDGTQD